LPRTLTQTTRKSHNMAPTRTRKRKSDMSSPATSSPIKKQRKMGLSILQKQALIDNLQLERMSQDASSLLPLLLTLPLQSRNAPADCERNTMSRHNTSARASRCASIGYQPPSARPPWATSCRNRSSPRSQSLHALRSRLGHHPCLSRTARHQSQLPGRQPQRVSQLQLMPRAG